MVEAKVILDATMVVALCFSSLVMIAFDCKVVIDAITMEASLIIMEASLIIMEASLLTWDDIGVVEAIRDMTRKVSTILFSFYIERRMYLLLIGSLLMPNLELCCWIGTSSSLLFCLVFSCMTLILKALVEAVFFMI